MSGGTKCPGAEFKQLEKTFFKPAQAVCNTEEVQNCTWAEVCNVSNVGRLGRIQTD